MYVRYHELQLTIKSKYTNFEKVNLQKIYLIEIPPQKQINYSTCNEILRNQLIRNIVM